MKVNELLCENLNPNAVKQIITEITHNCQPFLHDIGYQVSDLLLYRGIGHNVINIHPNSPNILRSFPGFNANRKPTDTPDYVHNETNHIFKQLFKYPFRSGTFVSGSEKEAKQYGNVGLVIPAGEYHCLWSPFVVDFFNEWDEFISTKKFNAKHSNSAIPTNEDIMDSFLDLIENNKFQYRTGNIIEAIHSNHEIMVYCDRVFLLPTDDINVSTALREIQRNYKSQI